MSETPDFAARVIIADQIVDVAKRVVRTLRGSPTSESELELATDMVKLRDLLVQVRDDIGLDHGPEIELEKLSSGKAYELFVDGFRILAKTYMRIQEERCDDVDWSGAAHECVNLIVGIRSLLDFLAVAHAWENNMPWGRAKQHLQLARDRRRIKAPPGGDERELLPDESPKGVTKEDLIHRYNARSARAIREMLKKEGVKVLRNGKPGREYLFEEVAALAACDKHYSRKSELSSASGQNQTTLNDGPNDHKR